MAMRRIKNQAVAAAALFACVVLCGGIPAAEPCAARPCGMPATAMPAVTASHIRIEDDYVDINAAYPVVSGMKDAAFQSALNGSIKKTCRAG